MHDHHPDEAWPRITIDCMKPGCGWSKVSDEPESLMARFREHVEEKHS